MSGIAEAEEAVIASQRSGKNIEYAFKRTMELKTGSRMVLEGMLGEVWNRFMWPRLGSSGESIQKNPWF
jgi:hypothetical protein